VSTPPPPYNVQETERNDLFVYIYY
jgi:hypothetical protein